MGLGAQPPYSVLTHPAHNGSGIFVPDTRTVGAHGARVHLFTVPAISPQTQRNRKQQQPPNCFQTQGIWMERHLSEPRLLICKEAKGQAACFEKAVIAKEQKALLTPHEVNIQRHLETPPAVNWKQGGRLVQKKPAWVSRHQDTTTTVEAARAEQCDCCGTAVKKATNSVGIAVNTLCRWTDADLHVAATAAAT